MIRYILRQNKDCEIQSNENALIWKHGDISRRYMPNRKTSSIQLTSDAKSEQASVAEEIGINVEWYAIPLCHLLREKIRFGTRSPIQPSMHDRFLFPSIPLSAMRTLNWKGGYVR